MIDLDIKSNHTDFKCYLKNTLGVPYSEFVFIFKFIDIFIQKDNKITYFIIMSFLTLA